MVSVWLTSLWSGIVSWNKSFEFEAPEFLLSWSDFVSVFGISGFCLFGLSSAKMWSPFSVKTSKDGLLLGEILHWTKGRNHPHWTLCVFCVLCLFVNSCCFLSGRSGFNKSSLFGLKGFSTVSPLNPFFVFFFFYLRHTSIRNMKLGWSQPLCLEKLLLTICSVLCGFVLLLQCLVRLHMIHNCNTVLTLGKYDVLAWTSALSVPSLKMCPNLRCQYNCNSGVKEVKTSECEWKKDKLVSIVKEVKTSESKWKKDKLVSLSERSEN